VLYAEESKEDNPSKVIMLSKK